ncbi:MAG: hypothetical protein ABFS35_16865 [Bacteroidota bacterium]
MQKLWKLKESKSDKLIFIKEKCIYKGNPKENELNRINMETEDISFLSNLFSIPYSYIKKIENQKGKKYIKIYFGNDSAEELNINNEDVKKEIFDYLKLDNPKLNYSSKLPSVIGYGKAQFLALLTITGIFIWSMYLAIQIESGIEYEIVGGRVGLSGIILAIANMGIMKIISGYLVLLLISVYALLKKLKSRTEIEILKR